MSRFLQLTCPAYVPNFFLRPVASPARHLAAIDTSITLASFPTTWNREQVSLIGTRQKIIKVDYRPKSPLPINVSYGPIISLLQQLSCQILLLREVR